MSLYQNNPILQEYEKQAMALEEKQKEIDKLKQETEELEQRIEILCRMDSQETHTIQELNAIFELLEVKRTLISELEEEKNDLEAAYTALDIQLVEEPNILNVETQPENLYDKEEKIYGSPETEEKPNIGASSSSMAQIEEDDVVTVKFGDHGPIFLKDDMVTVKFEENGTIFLGNNGKPEAAPDYVGSTKYLVDEDWSPSLLRDIHSPSPESFSLARSPSPESVTSVRSPGRCEDEKIAAESPVPRVSEEPPYEAPDYTFSCHKTAINSLGSSSYHRDDEAAKCVRKFLKREGDRLSRDTPAVAPSNETELNPDLPDIENVATIESSQDEELVQETSEIEKKQEDDALVHLPSILIPEILPEDDDHEWILKAARRLQLVEKHVYQDVPSFSVRNDAAEVNNRIDAPESDDTHIYEELPSLGQILPETILEEVPPSLKSDVMEKRKPAKERKTSKQKTKKRKDANNRLPIVSEILWPIDHQYSIHGNDYDLEVVPVTRDRKDSNDVDNEEWVGMEIAIRNSLENQETRENGEKEESLAPPSNSAKRATQSKNEEGNRDGFSRKSRERRGRKSKKSLMLLPQELCGTDNFLSFLATLTSLEIAEKETGPVESETSTAATTSSIIMNQETTEETETSSTVVITPLYPPKETILYMGGSHYDDVMTVLSDDRSRWTRARIKMPGSLISGAVICINQEIYLLGGFPNNKSLQKLEIQTRKWITLAEMNVGRVLIQKSTVEMNGFIWVLGGEDSRGKALKSVELYDPRLDVWAKIRNMNYARSRAAAAVWNEKIFICGGIVSNSDDDNSCLKSVECFDPESGIWTLLVDMPAALCDHTLLTYKNRLILMGGRFGSILTTAIAELEEENDRWKPADKMPDVPMATGVVLDDEIYALGGLDELLVATRRVEIFDGNRWRWSQSLPYTWNHSYCIVIPRELAQSLCE